mmetsp:Transcript_14878/g.35910  ORF Transcript_14878/g.35910 Transcript_14878/m.35910 type:complete len:233 (+) Transcript_14878:441-1139(+)
MFFTHLFACPWGSIMSGQRRALAIMMPLSMEKESLGKPAMPHSRIATGSPKQLLSEYLALEGMPACLHCATQESAIPSRNAMVKVPKYEIIPALISMSPVRFWYASPSWFMLMVQRSFSPPRPPINFSARSSLSVHSSTSPSSRAFFSTLSLSCFSIAASLVISSFSSSCLILSAAMIVEYSSSASASASFLGSTNLATLSYESMAHTHLHSPSAALDALAALAGVKSGLEV